MAGHQVAIFRSNSISPDPRVEKVAKVVSDLADVTVVGWDRFGDQPQSQLRDGYRLQLFSHPAAFGKGISNLFHLGCWNIFLAWWVIRYGKSARVYHACDFDTIFPALLGKFLFGARVVYDIFDFYADHVRNTPGWILNLVRRLDLWAVRVADVVILVDEIRIEQLKGIQPRSLEIVYNTPEDMPGIPALKIAKKDGLRIAYVGVLQIERGLLELVEAVRDHPNWTLDLAGFGSDEAFILNKARQSPGVTWHGRVTYAHALQLSQEADVLVATYDPDIPNHRFASPNKIFEAMMLSKPIIVAEGTHIDEIVRQWDCGLVVPYGNPAALEAALQTLRTDPALGIRLGSNGRRAYMEKYSWQMMEEKITGIYKGLLNL